MKKKLIPLCIVIFSKLLESEALFAGISYGSLSGSWTFNMTFIMENFEGDILHLADYGRNQLLLKEYSDVTKTKAIEITYNSVRQGIYLLSLCGCDPCHGMLMKFDIYAFERKITLQCNNHRYYVISQFNIYNRERIVMHEFFLKSEKRNIINIVIYPTKKGCMQSFYHNAIPLLITLKGPNSNFLYKCPRDCPPAMCNKGHCRILDGSGPPCNCSSTAFNGPYCNNPLREYIRESNNSYEIVKGANNIYLKLSWRRFSNQRYCLLQLVYRDGQDTLSIYGAHLMKGRNILGDIDDFGVNYLSIASTDNNLEIKVNDKVVERSRVFFEGSHINIGFSECEQSCKEFHGTYDFEINQRSFRPVRRVVTCNGDAKEKPSPSVGWKIVVVCVVVLVIVLGISIALVFYLRNHNCGTAQRNTPENELTNVYDGEVSVPMLNTKKGFVDDSSVYEVVEPSAPMYSSTMDQPPELPPR